MGGRIERTLQLNGGAVGPYAHAVEGARQRELAGQGGVPFEAGVGPPFAAVAGCAEDRTVLVHGCFCGECLHFFASAA